jgi:hypothetical protein
MHNFVKYGVIPASVQKLHPYTLAYIAAMTGKPSGTRAGVIDAYVRGIAAVSGLWAKFDCLWLPANFSEEASRINLVNPGYGDLINSNTPTFTVDFGWRGSASGTVHNNIACNALAKLTLNSAHIAAYSMVDANEATRIVSAGSSGAPYLSLLPRISGVAQTYMNQAITGPVSITEANSIGYYIGNRSTAALQELWKGNATLGTNTTASSVVNGQSFHLCGYQGAGSVNRVVSIAHIGSSLTTGDRAVLNTLANNYLSSIGAI